MKTRIFCVIAGFVIGLLSGTTMVVEDVDYQNMRAARLAGVDVDEIMQRHYLDQQAAYLVGVLFASDDHEFTEAFESIQSYVRQSKAEFQLAFSLRLRIACIKYPSLNRKIQDYQDRYST